MSEERELLYIALKSIERMANNSKLTRTEKKSLKHHIDAIKAYLFADLWEEDDWVW